MAPRLGAKEQMTRSKETIQRNLRIFPLDLLDTATLIILQNALCHTQRIS